MELSTNGKSPVDDAVIVRDRFIGHLVTARSGELDQTADLLHLEQIGWVSFLLGPHATHFIDVTVPSLLYQLSRQTIREQVETHGRVQGRVDWPSTYKSRLSQDNDPSVLVCRQVRRQYATPENELFKYVLEWLQHVLGDTSSDLRSGIFWTQPNLGHAASVAVALSARYEQMQRYLSHIYLRDITAPNRITGRHLQKALVAKTEEYAEVAVIYEKCTQIASIDQVSTIAELVRHCLVLPTGMSTEAERLSQLIAWLVAS